MPDSPKAASFASSHRSNAQQANHIELRRRPLRRPLKPTADTEDKPPRLLRGKGVPPPAAKEWEYHPSKGFITGKSWASSLTPIIHQQQAEESTPQPPARTTIRMSNRAYESHLAGGAVAVTSPPEAFKPHRRPAGKAGPRTERVLGMPTGDDAEMTAQPMYALLGTARRDLFVTSRPTTAPACVLLTKPQTRVGYEKGRAAYDDVLQYRHSGGICPPEYKLASERPNAPPVAAPVTTQARSSFFDSRSGYELNKMRGRVSDVI